MTTERAVAWIELLLAVAFTYVTARAAWGVLLPPTDPRARYEEWSVVLLYVASPFAVTMWICAVALFRGWRHRWRLHVLPIIALIAACLADWWLPYVVV